MSKLRCIFGHKWSNWFSGLQPLNDKPAKQWTRQCSTCDKYEFKYFPFGVEP